MAQPLRQPAPGPLHLGSETFACSIVVDIIFLLFFFNIILMLFCCGFINFLFFLFVFKCFDGTTLEATSVRQLTEDLVEFYQILYAGPRFLSEQEVDRPLLVFSLSLCLNCQKIVCICTNKK